MRDPARINPLIERLRNAWLSQPDLRLGQIVVNANMKVRNGETDAFHIEDKELIDTIEKMLYNIPS